MTKRILTFSELACLYFPGCSCSKNAVRCLNRWIKKCSVLMAELSTTGYQCYNHRHLTPKQFTMIITHLGDPFDN